MPHFSLFSKFSSFFTLVFVLTLFWGCTSTQEKTYSASQLFQQGKRLAKLKDTEEAKEKIQLLLEDYPDSKERKAATMLLADLHYAGEEYEESKFHYQKFIELYPANQFVDRAHFYKAMSSFKLTDLASRDLTPVNSALEEFQRFAQDFPQSSYQKKTKDKIYQCLDLLAQNMFEIGKFYYRTGSYQAAILRLKRLKEEYPNHAYVLEAEFLLGESYYHEQNFPTASTYYKVVIKSSPRSEFAKEARLRLKTMR
jgi:outer membrane protein assembly factor BamD